MPGEVRISKFSIGIGDRFVRQAEAQLRACILASKAGVDVIPVWNKSHREHAIIGSRPSSARAAADEAVRKLGWTKPYYVDADHINLSTSDGFLDSCDFYTLDVAGWIGCPNNSSAVEAFVSHHPELVGELQIPGIEDPFRIDRDFVARAADKYLSAVEEAGRIYRHLAAKKGKGRFVTEVSMDETVSPQTPVELLIILAAVADQGIPAQTIAPKFTGRFNKGVDYVGDVSKFTAEFSGDVAAIAFAIRQYDLPPNLKLSVHSGSDKFSLYGPIHQALRVFDAGVHLKTAGTTWLEELIGPAEAGGVGLELAKDIYAEAYSDQQELSAPYASVIDIDPARLPEPGAVRRWSSEQFVSALRYSPGSPGFNSNVRQLLHMGYKVAARMGNQYLDLLSAFQTCVARNVTGNLYERHIKPLFLGA